MEFSPLVFVVRMIDQSQCWSLFSTQSTLENRSLGNGTKISAESFAQWVNKSRVDLSADGRTRIAPNFILDERTKIAPNLSRVAHSSMLAFCWAKCTIFSTVIYGRLMCIIQHNCFYERRIVKHRREQSNFVRFFSGARARNQTHAQCNHRTAHYYYLVQAMATRRFSTTIQMVRVHRTFLMLLCCSGIIRIYLSTCLCLHRLLCT